MATTGNTPPQAYTREMLSQAFEWLKSQPAYVRERATTADGLVSMYLQSRRSTNGSPLSAGSPAQGAAPVDVPSVESFKSDLRNLAENMRSFETAEAPVTIRPPIHQRHAAETLAMAAPAPTTATSHAPAGFSSTTQPLSPPSTATVTAGISAPKPIEPRHSYDSQTMECIQTVRQKLNLSSDSEALRMLVKLGFEKVRSILS